MTTRCLVVTGGGSVGKCCRLPSWLLVRTNSHAYLLILAYLTHEQLACNFWVLTTFRAILWRWAKSI